MKIHPLCLKVPPYTPEQFERLCQSMRNGFDEKDPIITLAGMILDGRNRHDAAVKMKVKPIYRDWHPGFDGDTPEQFVLRRLTHRDLTQAQRAAVAVDLLPAIEKEAEQREKAGVKAPPRPNPTAKLSEGRHERESSAVAAKAAGTSATYVKNAKAIKQASPATFEKMKSGEIGMAEAKATIKAPPRPVKKGPPTPPEIEKAIAALPLFKAEINVLHACRRRVKALSLTEPGVELAAKAWKRIDAALSEAANDIRFKAPYCQCPLMPTCEVGCKQCRGRKWISMEVFRLLPPKLQEGIVPFASSPVLDTEGDSQ